MFYIGRPRLPLKKPLVVQKKNGDFKEFSMVVFLHSLRRSSLALFTETAFMWRSGSVSQRSSKLSIHSSLDSEYFFRRTVARLARMSGE